MLNKKTRCTALAGVSTLGVTGAGVAVNVNPNGHGQVLLFPYYTVREAEGGAFNTLLSVVNTTGSAKSVKLRFREGNNARETLDLNVYLSAYDIWTAALVPTAAGAALKTTDSSCTTPTPLPAAGRDFVNTAYSGLGPTGAPAWEGSATLYLTAGATTPSTASSATYYGLPAIGFSVNRYTYKEMPTAGGPVLANFGGNFMHKGSRVISLSLP